jgi:hypothetical protein
MGVARGDLRYIREKYLGVEEDWSKGGLSGGEVVLSEDGVRKVLGYGGIETGEVDLGLCYVGGGVEVVTEVKKEEKVVRDAVANDGLIKMRVTKIPMNPRMVLGVKLGGGG